MEYNNYGFENLCRPNMYRGSNMRGYGVNQCPCARCPMTRCNGLNYNNSFMDDGVRNSMFNEFPFVMPRIVSVDADELF